MGEKWSGESCVWPADERMASEQGCGQAGEGNGESVQLVHSGLPPHTVARLEISGHWAAMIPCMGMECPAHSLLALRLVVVSWE